MSLFDSLNAEQVARIIAAQRRSDELSPLQKQIVADCVVALPNAEATTPVDALALLVVARQVVCTMANPDPEQPPMSEDDRRESLEWSAHLIGRVVALFEAQTGIAAESYIGNAPRQVN